MIVEKKRDSVGASDIIYIDVTQIVHIYLEWYLYQTNNCSPISFTSFSNVLKKITILKLMTIEQ